ncbi:MAG: Hsp20/alpha crystallin family protein [Firmicutes bacterium]|nr:Hsp20/alpha crystallin family protein [Bacillota bacterium]
MLIPFNPVNELERLRHEVNRIFDTNPVRQWRQGLSTYQPSLDIYQTDGEIVAAVEIPGINPKDIDITVSKDMLAIKGELKQEEEVKEEGYFRTERRFGSFRRVVPLPVEVKAKEAKASFKNGVLEVRIPKAKDQLEEGFKPQIEH